MPYLLVLMVAMVACTGSPAQPDRVTKDKPFELRAGEAALTADDIRIRFDTVRSDSRCPSGAQCIWAGEAVVAVTLSRGETSAGRELTIPGERSSTTFETVTVTFQGLQPYPGTGRNTQPGDYVATFVVTVR